MTSRSPYSPPQSVVADAGSPDDATEVAVKRGVLLSLFLCLALLSCIATWILYAALWERMVAKFPVAALYTLTLISLFRAFSIVAIWRMSRIGVVLYVFLTVIAIVVSSSVGITQSWFGAMGAVVLVLLVFRKWSRMQWGLSRVEKRL